VEVSGMANKGQIPDWLKQLWKELTTPPHFVPQPNKKNANKEKSDTHSSHEKRKQEEHGEDDDDRPSWWSSWSISPLTVKRKKAKIKTGTANTRKKKGKSAKRTLKNPSRTVHSNVQSTLGNNTSHQDLLYTPSESLWVNVPKDKREIENVFIRQGYHPQAIERYPFSVYQAEPFGSIIRLQTSDGWKAIKRTHLPPERIEFMDQAVRHVMKRGFTRIAPFALTKKKTPYTIVGGNVYYMSDWVSGHDCDFTSMIHLAEAAQTLAQFHHASIGFEPSAMIPPTAYHILETFQQRSKDLADFKKKIRIKSKLDAMDKFFLEHIDEYQKQVQKAILIVSDPSVKDFLSRDARNPGLCHLDVTQRNLIYTTKHHVHLIDLDFMTFAPRALDIAHLMRRSMQKTGWTREVSLVCLVNVNSVKKISRDEYLLILALLTFPHRFWHIAYTHYTLQVNGHSLGYLQQLQALEEKKRAFLQTFEQQVQRYID
jgi:CotS family spore coat protein